MRGMKSFAKALIVSIGIVAILTGSLGIRYVVPSIQHALNGAFDDLVMKDGIRYFYPVFFISAGFCIACYIAMIGCGIALLRFRLRWAGLLIGVLIFEFVRWIVMAGMMTNPSIGPAIAAASGVATGGDMYQFFVLFPLWAPIALWWSKRQLNRLSEQTPDFLNKVQK
jgi:hypothetical protein